LATKFLGLDLLGALDAGETIGLVSTLAQPNLTALSGETADFLAGGEFPIPLSQGLGSVSIEYKKFGVSLSYTPTVLANGRISLRVRPEVSELSSDGAITINGFNVPALTVRRTETTVELGSGQSFMIAGLMKNSSQNAIKKLPGAGDLPILGSLFRSTNFQKGETELVIVVTPYLVNPVNDHEIKLPTDGYSAPNELQRLLGNEDNSGHSGAVRPGPTSAPQATTAPSVGAADTATPTAPTAPAAGKSAALGDAPKPGFNLK
jgi:pilus assembly protein CpaC